MLHCLQTEESAEVEQVQQNLSKTKQQDCLVCTTPFDTPDSKKIILKIWKDNVTEI